MPAALRRSWHPDSTPGTCNYGRNAHRACLATYLRCPSPFRGRSGETLSLTQRADSRDDANVSVAISAEMICRAICLIIIFGRAREDGGEEKEVNLSSFYGEKIFKE